MQTLDFLGDFWEYDCMGCAVADESMVPPGGMIKRTPHFCVHQDPLIPLPGFLVVASTRHIQAISEMQDEEYEEFAGLVKDSYQAIKAVTGIENLTIVQEEYSVHFHLWFFPWTQAVIARYGKPSLSKIREIMVDLRKAPIGPIEWAELEKTIEGIRGVLIKC